LSCFVFVHGAWHTGALLEASAAPLREAGHEVYLPTLAGNRPGDLKTGGLNDAIESLLGFIVSNDLTDFVLAGHSYGGMVITGTADRIAERIRRLVYWNAFVPNDGEALDDMTPPEYTDLFDQLVQDDGSMMLPFPIWREAFINDASLELAEAAYRKLNPQPRKTFSEPIKLSRNPSAFEIPKSYINCTEDTSLPHHLPWHPRLSQKLGLFRLIQTPGSHELCFTDPALLAQKLIEAGRD
jgi:pimeloyl-ACP methyl ester carboxylesterase